MEGPWKKRELLASEPRRKDLGRTSVGCQLTQWYKYLTLGEPDEDPTDTLSSSSMACKTHALKK